MLNRIASVFCLVSLIISGWAGPTVVVAQGSASIDPEVTVAADRGGTVDVLVFLSEQADLSRAAAPTERLERRRSVHRALQAVAGRTQSNLRAFLDAAAIAYRPLWIVNAIAVTGIDADTVARIAAHPDVARIALDPWLPVTPAGPGLVADGEHPMRNLPWNVAHIGAPAVWAVGNTGQSAVVGILDTGCDWQHPAVHDQYRGWDGAVADHDYNWFDVTTHGGSGCGPAAPEPCDDHGHGTHLLGAVVGDDGQGMQIGVAPGARWIACRCIAGGASSPSLFFAGFEWMLAPRPVGGGEGDPQRAPEVIVTAWYCHPSQGCPWGVLWPAVAAMRAAGIVVVASAGSTGPGCGTIMTTPASFDEAYTVGAVGTDDLIMHFSGRGPATTPQGVFLKPDLTAPGINVLSSVPGGGYAFWSGTAMAAAQVAGVVALAITAAPELAGDPEAIEQRLNQTAVPLLSDQCGDDDLVPNNVYGHGRIDAEAACGIASAAPQVAGAAVSLLPNAPNPFNPRTVLTYELSRPGVTDLRIFDATGRLVRVLVSPERQAAGRHQVSWDGRDARGRDVATGVYFGLLTSSGARATERLVLLR